MLALRYSDVAPICFLALNAFAFVHSVKFGTRPSRRIKQQFVNDQLDGCSKVQCVSRCAEVVWCLSVSWSSNSRLCLLSNLDSITYSVDYADALEIDGAWTTVGQIRYPVALYRGPGGRYTMTYNQASQFCADMGMSMASEVYTIQLHQEGFHICNCGWVLEVKRIVVMSYEDLNCVPWFDTGYVVCDPNTHPLSDVWCELP